ncbi:hypothetical protein [Streptomyces sp. NPDC046727]|uniref:hypothetical protein n=1 Tax=Streptomyces sp. NPDC046727 TaxID=3155373 RepID=UPI0033D10A46
MTSALYEIETSEGDDGTLHPAEQIWTPCADGAAHHGFIAHQGLFVAGIDGGSDDDLYPVGFLVLGHQRWAAGPAPLREELVHAVTDRASGAGQLGGLPRGLHGQRRGLGKGP